MRNNTTKSQSSNKNLPQKGNRETDQIPHMLSLARKIEMQKLLHLQATKNFGCRKIILAKRKGNITPHSKQENGKWMVVKKVLLQMVAHSGHATKT